MKNLKNIVVVGIIVVAVIIGALTVSSKDVVKYNDTLVDIAGSVDAGFKPLSSAMDTYAEGKAKVDVAQLKNHVAALKGTITAKQQALSAIKIPDDDLCREFHKTVSEYVANSLAYQTKYQEVAAYIEAHNPGTDKDLPALSAIVAEVNAKDEALLKKVQECQTRMAKKYSIKLK